MLREIVQKRNVSLTAPPRWLLEYLGIGGAASGESFTVEGSLKVTAVLAGFTILTEDTSSLPLILYRRLERGKERAVDHPYYDLLHNAPNPEMTSMVYRELQVGHMLGWGNFFAQMLWDDAGTVTELWPLNPARMEIFRQNGERRYLYYKDDGQRVAFRQQDILHIPAFGFDGIKGYSRISLAKNAVGLALAAEKYGSRFFANDARPTVVLKSPKPMKAEAQKNLRDSWNEIYRSAENAGKVAILEEGLDLATIGIEPEAAQFLQTRQFQVAEIARMFRIPPHMLGDVTNSTSWGTGIEQQELGYLAHTLRPWLVRVEQQLNKDLLLPAERYQYFFEHLADALLRTDIVSRMNAYAVAINNAILSPNEAREAENRNPYDGGDTYRYPLNTGAAGAQPGSPTSPQRIMPVLLDTAERVSRYESNELRDATSRWLGKGKEEKFRAWLDEFYTGELPSFIRRSFRPYVEAGMLDANDLQKAAAHSSAARQANITVLKTVEALGAVEGIDPDVFICDLLGTASASHDAEVADGGSRPPRLIVPEEEG
jgi:HK97 family phage portal protein